MTPPTDVELDWLQAAHLDGFALRDAGEVAAAFRERFGRPVSAAWVAAIVADHCRGVQAEARAMLLLPTWSQHRFLVQAYRRHPIREAAARFNARYGTDHTWRRLSMYLVRRGVTKPDARTGFQLTEHQVGQEVVHWQQGARRPEPMVKTERGRRLAKKRVVVWEAAHGPVPDGHVVVFLVGRSCALDNLALVSRGELMILNQMRWQELAADRALRRAAIETARLKALAFATEREAHG